MDLKEVKVKKDKGKAGKSKGHAMDLKEVKDLIELVSEKGFAEFEIEHEGFRLHISRFKEPSVIQPAPTPVILSTPLTIATEAVAPAAPTAASALPAAAAQPAIPERQVEIVNSPIVGTFYRAPAPEAPPYVEVGSRVERGQVICLIEAMKLMNEIQADTAGEVVKIYVDNGQPVEFGQPLFGIKV